MYAHMHAYTPLLIWEINDRKEMEKVENEKPKKGRKITTKLLLV